MVVFPFLDQLDAYPMEDAHRALRDLAVAQRIPFLDLLPTYVAHREEDLVVNSTDAHPNERAHALAAAEILRFMETLGL